MSITTTVNLIDYGSNIVLRGACGISMTIVVCLLILTFLVRLDRATKFAGELLPEVEAIANRCEGCGYDLTHLPIGGVCTECGLATESSLVPERRRPGTPWQQRRDVLGWLETVGDCLLWPHRIYGAMQMKKAFAESVRFARWHFGVMAVGAALWAILLTQTQSELGWPVYLFVPLMAAAAASLAGWFWHRLVGAIVFTYAVAQKLFTDAQWGRHVLMYESAFLWVFCAFNGLMITSFIVFDGNWISHFFTGRQLFFFLGMPLELFVILMGNLVLTLAWFYRYSIAIRAVRWSNF
ncbi:MAG: hypothetical protein IPK83_10615 [Planctomycetes bacterium]|nr:hypothetical protein [Planctomycetota bacterium]